jgi:hypothetical protein
MDTDLTASNYNSSKADLAANLELTDPQNQNNPNGHHDQSNKYNFNGETTKPISADAASQQQQDFGGFSNTLDVENVANTDRPTSGNPNYDASHRYENSNSNYETQDHHSEHGFAQALDDGKHDMPGDNATHTANSEEDSSSDNDEETSPQRNRRRRCIGGGGIAAIILVWFLFGGIGRRGSYSYNDPDDSNGTGVPIVENATMVPTTAN